MNSRILTSRSLRHLSVKVFGAKPISCHARQLSVMHVSLDKKILCMPKTQAPNLQLFRYKSNKKKSKKAQQDEESDEEDKEEEEEEDGDVESSALPGETEKVLKVAQLRVDKIARSAMGTSRIVEDAYLEGRLWKNEMKVLKKASQIHQGDIIDIELGPDPKNPNLIKSHRIEILEVKEGSHCHVRVLVSKNLSIPPFSS